jgi:anti-sigma factor RsiW
MTTCNKIQPRLTAYLDGELADESGSVVRGHLRECAACRQVASDEAALRDGLRLLEPVDPPVSLWAGIQSQLAAAEVADARTPVWRRAAARWTRWARGTRWTPTMRQLATASFAAAAAVAVVTWRGQRADEPQGGAITVIEPPRTPLGDSRAEAAPAPTTPEAPPAADVTDDLRGESERTTASYDRVVEELMKLAEAARPRWSDGDRSAFDARLAGLKTAIVRADQPRSVQRAQRSLIRYLQSAIVRDDMLLASGGTR